MHITTTAITGTIKKGELVTENALSLFPDGTEVIVLPRADFNLIAGSDHTRHQLAETKKELAATKAEAAQLREAARK